MAWHGGNYLGNKGNRGGKFKRVKFGIDFSQFQNLAEDLQALGADLQELFDDVLEQTAENVQFDVDEAMDAKNLPAKGRYSRGITRKSIDKNPKPKWSGTVGSVGYGFDKTKPNAGSWLITGTPRMQPNYKLEDIFARKKYTRDLAKDIMEYLMDALEIAAGGK